MRKQIFNDRGLVYRHWPIAISPSATTYSQKIRAIKDQSDTYWSKASELEEIQITLSGLKRLVQEILTKRGKVQDEVINFYVESKDPAREVFQRKVVEVREGKTIKNQYQNIRKQQQSIRKETQNSKLW